MSLLDDVSIVVTPNGVKASKLYAVIPSNGDADMDVTRATAATRVDENGLVNYAEILGGEEVTNGDFANGTTDWSAEYSATLSIVSGQLKIVGGRSAQGITTIIGKTYSISANITNIDTVGGIRIKVSNNFNLDGAYYNSAYNATTTPVLIESIFTATATTTFVGSDQNGTSVQSALLDNISVKEVTRDNVPRIDYTGEGCPHILAEPQRTNLLTYSEDFSQWAAEESSVSLNTLETLSPDGGNNATILTENTSFGKHGVVVNTTSGGSSYSFSFFAKYKTRQFISIVTSDDVYWQSQVVVNLIDGSITKEFSRSYTITNKVEDFGNGWYKISASINGTYNTRFYSRIYLSNVAVPSDPPNNFYTGESLSAYIWAAQLEVGSFPTSYIPTSGSTVTRNQDIFTRDGIGSLINSTEGVLFLEVAALADDGTNRYLSISDGTTSNYIYFRFVSTSNTVLMRTVVATSTINTLQTAISDTTAYNKFAFKWKSGDYAFWINGVEELVEASATIFGADVLNKIEFSFPTAGGGGFPSKVKQLQVYKTALTDVQLAALTT